MRSGAPFHAWPRIGNRTIAGICGQVDGSVTPGLIGLEAGQSAFGDLYNWFKNIVKIPTELVLKSLNHIPEAHKESILDALENDTLSALEKEALTLSPQHNSLVALDWINGRRTPHANQRLSMAIKGLTIGMDTVHLYRALVEATAFGARKIVECFEEQGVKIDKITGIGGIAKKSPLVMQICSDVLNRPIDIIDSEESCARGAALFASVAAGIYATVADAQAAMKPVIQHTYTPRTGNVVIYDTIYKEYLHLGEYVEA